VATRRLRGATAVVSEAEDGTVTIRVNDRLLPARLYPTAHAHLAPGVVVDYPHLDGVFAWIAAQQQERDVARLANPKISGREKQRIRAGSAPRIPGVEPHAPRHGRLRPDRGHGVRIRDMRPSLRSRSRWGLNSRRTARCRRPFVRAVRVEKTG